MPTIQYSDSPNVDTAFVVQEGGQKNRAVLTAPQDTSTLELPDNPNSTKGYVTVDGKKHKVVLTANIAGGGSGGGDVSSVNGKTGVVVLDAEDVSAIPQYTTMPEASSSNVGQVVQYIGANSEGQVTARQTVGTGLTNIQVDAEQFKSTGETLKNLTYGNYLSYVRGEKDGNFDFYITDPLGLQTAIQAKLVESGYNDSLDYIAQNLVPGDMATDTGTMIWKYTDSDEQIDLQLVWMHTEGGVSEERQINVESYNYITFVRHGAAGEDSYEDQYISAMSLTGWSSDVAYYGVTYTGTPVANDVISVKKSSDITHNYFYESKAIGTDYIWERVNVQPSPTVDSVNGKTGTVVLNASDVGAVQEIEYPTELVYDSINPNNCCFTADFVDLETGDYYFYVKVLKAASIGFNWGFVWQKNKVAFHWDSDWDMSSYDDLLSFSNTIVLTPVIDGDYAGSQGHNDLINNESYSCMAYGFTGSYFMLKFYSSFASDYWQYGSTDQTPIFEISKLYGGTTPVTIPYAETVTEWYSPAGVSNQCDAGNHNSIVRPVSIPNQINNGAEPVSDLVSNNINSFALGYMTNDGVTPKSHFFNFRAFLDNSNVFECKVTVNKSGAYEQQITKASGIFESARCYIYGNRVYAVFDAVALGNYADQSATIYLTLGQSETDMLSGIWIESYVLDVANATLIPQATGCATAVLDTPSDPYQLNGIVQYIGATTANYTNGYFYKVTGTVVTVPSSITCTEIDGLGIDVTMDVDAFIAYMLTLAYDKSTIENWLNQGSFVFQYDYDQNTINWSPYGILPDTSAVLACLTFSPAVTTGQVVSWTTSNYTPGYQELQGGAWAQVGVMSVETALQSITGYDATKTQTLQNVLGTFTWVDNI